MTNRLTKIAAAALVSLTAAAPMAMAYGVAPGAQNAPLPVSVERLAPQPDLAYQLVSAADTRAEAGAVKVASLGAEPRMPFAQQTTGESVEGVHAVVTGNLAVTPATLH